MLAIRAEQMLVFSEQARQKFVDKMVSLIKTSQKEKANYSESKTRERVTSLISTAESFEITEENNVQKFIKLLFDLSDDIFEESEISSILKSKRLTESSKIAFLHHEINLIEVTNE